MFKTTESAWDAARAELERRVDEYAALKGTLNQGPDRLLAAYRLNDALGQLAYGVYFYPSLKFDEDQRDNAINGRRQQVQILAAKGSQAMAWFNPELLAVLSVPNPHGGRAISLHERQLEVLREKNRHLERRLSELPRNSSKTRIRNRCELTGRPRAVYRKFKMARNKLRELASKGQIPGMVKSSW